MPRTVTPGESILPHLTADTWNRLNRRKPQLGQQVPPTEEHQNIVTGIYKGAGNLNPWEAVGINAAYKAGNPTATNPRYTDQITEYNWAITREALSPDKPCEAVVWGVVRAYVTIIQSWHQYVTYLDGGLVSANWGKGQLLVASTDANPSLICIGQRVQANGIAYASEAFEARDGVTCPSQVCSLVDLDNTGKFIETGITLTLYNTQPNIAQGGFVQFKEWAGKYILDVSPCADEVEEFPFEASSSSS